MFLIIYYIVKNYTLKRLQDLRLYMKIFFDKLSNLKLFDYISKKIFPIIIYFGFIVLDREDKGPFLQVSEKSIRSR